MSGQINLYHERFRKKREWLTLTNAAIAGGALALVLAVAGAVTWRDAAARAAEAAAAEASLKTVKAQVDAQTQAAAGRKPNAQIAADIAATEAVLQRREQIARLLEGGVAGSTQGFSGYLRGFAHQTLAGLWLTGISIGGTADDMEIHGRALDGAVLPDYIRRLGSEPVFQGRSFAALTLSRSAAAAPAAATVSPAPTLSAGPIDFVLKPQQAETGGRP